MDAAFAAHLRKAAWQIVRENAPANRPSFGLVLPAVRRPTRPDPRSSISAPPSPARSRA